MPSAEEILFAPWRELPSWLLVVVGAWLAVRGLRMSRSVPPELRDPHRALVIARSFRIVIAGACVVGLGVGWLLSVWWVVGVAFLILAEEMLETSTMIGALKAGSAAARKSVAVEAEPSDEIAANAPRART